MADFPITIPTSVSIWGSNGKSAVAKANAPWKRILFIEEIIPSPEENTIPDEIIGNTDVGRTTDLPEVPPVPGGGESWMGWGPSDSYVTWVRRALNARNADDSQTVSLDVALGSGASPSVAGLFWTQ